MAKTRARSGFRPKLIAVAVSSCFVASAAFANPTGPAVVNGTASIVQNGNLLQITNSPNAIINWQSFSIGANEITRFLQQSASSAVLNRVVTQNPSAILGALQSNGRVFIINPNGITFGAGSQVDVAGLVASSLNLSNEDFLAGRMRFTEVSGAGSVVNEGNINTTSGGSVYLVGPAVTNSGIITSPQGEVILAAGNSVELVSPGTPNLRVEIAATDNQAVNLGQVIADAGRIGIYAGLINNSGTIRADSAVAEGGRILLKATKSATLESSSVLSAQGQGGGKIEVLANESVQVAGRLDASAPNGGDGGFIETSAAKVQVNSGASITTAAPYGKTGTWLIDPTDFIIAASGGDITGATLSSNLESSDIVISTPATGPDNGDIFVNDAVSWSSGNSLTLTAIQNVNVNQSITNGGTGGVNLYAGWDGVSSPTSPTLSNSGSIALSAPITTGGDVILAAGGFGSVGQNSAGVITANGLMVDGLDVFLSSDFNGAVNLVNTLAGRSRFGSFFFTNGKQLTIGDVGGKSGIVSGPGCCDATVNIRVTQGNLIVNRNITAVAGNSDGVGTANILLFTENGSIIVSNAAVISAIGASVPGNSGGSGGGALVTLNTTVGSGGSITVAGGSRVEAFGGNAGSGSGSGGDAAVTLISDQSITVDNSAIKAFGGMGNGVEGQGGQANISLSANNGPLVVSQSTFASAGGAGGSSNGGIAGVSLSSSGSGGISISNATITATGGPGSSSNGGFASMFINNNGPTGVAISGSTIRADGAEGGIFVQSNSNIAITDSTVSAIGREPSSFSWSAQVDLAAVSGAISTAGSVISAIGVVGVESPSGIVALNAPSDIVLGLLQTDANGRVGVGAGGAITDGNSGLNLAAPEAVLSAGNGIGSIADPLETAVGQISLTSTGGEVGIINSGDMLLSNLTLVGSGGAAVGATGTLNVLGPAGVGGNLSLIGGNVNVGSASSFSSTSVSSGGTLLVSTPGTFTVQGGSGQGASASVAGGAGVIVFAGGNVMVTGGSGSGADAVVSGNPDVAMSVGGTVQLTGNMTSGSSARIEADTPSTIYLEFPLISSGGYFVNGVEGAIVDDMQSPVSGFFVQGMPAVLDENMFVTYGGAPVFNDILVATMNQQADVLADQLRAGETGRDPEEDEKKKLPVCGE